VTLPALAAALRVGPEASRTWPISIGCRRSSARRLTRRAGNWLAFGATAIISFAAGAADAQLTSVPRGAPTTSVPTTVPGGPVDPIEQARRRALAPVPKAPAPPLPAYVWVPERRFYSSELQREIVVPGHYETRITDQQYTVPPLTGYGPQGQNPVYIPGGQRPPADLRQSP
jgi:hypothetical protein